MAARESHYGAQKEKKVREREYLTLIVSSPKTISCVPAVEACQLGLVNALDAAIPSSCPPIRRMRNSPETGPYRPAPGLSATAVLHLASDVWGRSPPHRHPPTGGPLVAVARLAAFCLMLFLASLRNIEAEVDPLGSSDIRATFLPYLFLSNRSIMRSFRSGQGLHVEPPRS